ncbi:VENN motif pre-toxin domain-containing protein [Moraxella catarrhalis]|nr:VENN motif pre-toxin domain-containing protein [Moraxella catarrhalis]
MWGDYQVDDPNTLTQAQKDKLINQAKLIAGITAVFAGEDVNVAAGVAAEAVENNATFIDKKNEVKKVILNGDKGIYKCNFQNDKCIDNPIKIGETMFEDAFISPDTGNPVGRVYIGESIDEYIYRLNDKAWSAGFYAEELYAYNSLPGNIYDIKSSYPNHERKSYHGFLFDGKYITLREGGNILAGMNAATLGIPYEEFQKASGALHAGGKLGLIRHKTTGYTYGTYPRYGEIDYQYLRSRYGYSLGLKRIECNLNNTNSLECKK